MLSLLVSLLLILPSCKRAPAQSPAATPVKAPPIVAAPRPTTPLPANASCITPACHATFLTAAHIHGPITAGAKPGGAACFTCHLPDQGNHTYPLARTGNQTCTFCHTIAGTKTHQHKALTLPPRAAPASALLTAAPAPSSDNLNGGGGCLNCHNPHASNAKFLLVTDTVDALCTRCHDVPLKKYAHQPFAAGQCTVCHHPHQSNAKNLLRNGDGPSHCFSCHAEKRTAMTTFPHTHKPATQSCTTCHGPHATDYPRQLRKPLNDTCLGCHKEVRAELTSSNHVHGAITEGNCASCHDPHASQQPNDLKARTTQVCLSCHNKPITTKDGRTLQNMAPILASTNLHGPVKTGDCSACHKPHAADQPNLLKLRAPEGFYAPFDLKNYALCFSCHDKQLVLAPRTTTLTNFRDGNENLHFVHVNRADKGRTCKTCHDVHGSNLPKHLAASVPFEGSSWSMPINYQQTPTGGSCAPGCHAQRSYNRNKPAAQTADRGAP